MVTVTLVFLQLTQCASRNGRDKLLDDHPGSAISIIQVVAGYLRRQVTELAQLRAEMAADLADDKPAGSAIQSLS